MKQERAVQKKMDGHVGHSQVGLLSAMVLVFIKFSLRSE